MAKKESRVLPVTSDADKELYLSFAMKVVADGFVSAEQLREQYGPEGFTRCIATLFRTYRMLREVRRSTGQGEPTLGYEWADQRFSQAQMKKMPPELQIVVERFKKSMVKYGDFVRIEARCRYVNKILGAMPREEATGDKINVFDRCNGAGSDVLIPRYCLRAMASKTLPALGKEAALARRIMFARVQIPAAAITIESRPIIAEDGRTGLGIQRSEMLPAGTEFTIKAMIPTTILRPEEYQEMLMASGEYIGLSPARSAGFGDFEVVEMMAE